MECESDDSENTNIVNVAHVQKRINNLKQELQEGLKTAMSRLNSKGSNVRADVDRLIRFVNSLSVPELPIEELLASWNSFRAASRQEMKNDNKGFHEKMHETIMLGNEVNKRQKSV